MVTLKKVKEVLIRHANFIGPGLVSSIAYIDPGNWATDLEAGANYGYKLLFIVLMAGLAAVVLQTLSVRLGAVTSNSLPTETRKLFLHWEAEYPKYRKLFRAGLWTLWALAEIAIIATDLAELLGSAIALNLLFPKLPLYAGVLITAADVMLILVFFRSNKGRQGMMFFEFILVAMVLAVFVSFMILLNLVKPDWREVFFGLVPSSTLVKPGALYIGIGIIGVMPHALFLGSHLASVDRLNMRPVPPTRARKPINQGLPGVLSILKLRRQRPGTDSPDNVELDNTERALAAEPVCDSLPEPSTPVTPGAEGPKKDDVKDEDEADYQLALKQYEADVRSFDRIRWVTLHVNHATVDTVYSLLGFALTINSSILTLAGAIFYYGTSGVSADDADLVGAHNLIRNYVGNGGAIIFALALLCAGQSASITATLAGQVVSEGFLQWNINPMLRRVVTRLIGVIPAAAVASAVGIKGLNTMLVASQVALCIVLPTVTVPLVYLCSRKNVMCVEGPAQDLPSSRPPSRAGSAMSGLAQPVASRGRSTALEGGDRRPPSPGEAVQCVPTEEACPPEHRRVKYFVSPLWMTVIGWLLCAVVILANGYVIVELALGKGG